jgi:hypothetical protein
MIEDTFPKRQGHIPEFVNLLLYHDIIIYMS